MGGVAYFRRNAGRRAGREEGGYGCAWCEARVYGWDEGGDVSVFLGGGAHSRGCCAELRALKQCSILIYVVRKRISIFYNLRSAKSRLVASVARRDTSLLH